jgi:hypothetical protein
MGWTQHLHLLIVGSKVVEIPFIVNVIGIALSFSTFVEEEQLAV